MCASFSPCAINIHTFLRKIMCNRIWSTVTRLTVECIYIIMIMKLYFMYISLSSVSQWWMNQTESNVDVFNLCRRIQLHCFSMKNIDNSLFGVNRYNSGVILVDLNILFTGFFVVFGKDEPAQRFSSPRSVIASFCSLDNWTTVSGFPVLLH